MQREVQRARPWHRRSRPTFPARRRSWRDLITRTSALPRPPIKEESSVRTVYSAPFSSSICMICILMSSTAGAAALLCSGETIRISMRPSTTCSTSPFSLLPPFEEKEEEKEEEEESGEAALPICRDGSRHSGPMFTVSTFFAGRFEVRR